MAPAKNSRKRKAAADTVDAVDAPAAPAGKGSKKARTTAAAAKKGGAKRATPAAPVYVPDSEPETVDGDAERDLPDDVEDRLEDLSEKVERLNSMFLKNLMRALGYTEKTATTNAGMRESVVAFLEHKAKHGSNLVTEGRAVANALGASYGTCGLEGDDDGEDDGDSASGAEEEDDAKFDEAAAGERMDALEAKVLQMDRKYLKRVLRALPTLSEPIIIAGTDEEMKERFSEYMFNEVDMRKDLPTITSVIEAEHAKFEACQVNAAKAA